jgi:hypothetical protein
VSRPGFGLRDAALGYAARGIPVLPLHYPVTRPRAVGAMAAGRPVAPEVRVGCSCRDPSCGPVGKHPIGALVPAGLAEATCNRARILAWWTRFPQANLGLACGHRFDVLDLDGPAGVAALRRFAHQHGIQLPAGGPVARTGRAEQGWHYYLAPTGLSRRGVLDHVDYQALGGYVVAPPSRHISGHTYQWARDLDHPLPQAPAALRELVANRRAERPAPVIPLRIPDGPGPAYARAALAEELARVAAARQPDQPGRRGRNDQLWESGRNLFNLVAAGALDEAEVEQGLLAAAQRNGLLADEPRQTRRTLRSAREVGLAHPRRLPERAGPEPTPNAPPPPATRDTGERTREGR